MQDTSPVVGDVMSTPPVVVRTHDSLWRAMDRFLATGLRHLVVLDDSDVVIGILEDRSVVAEWARDALGLHRATVGQLVHSLPQRAVAVSRDTLVQDAARLMIERDVNALPVVGVDGHVVGVVTGTDLVRVLVTQPVVRAAVPRASVSSAG